MKKSLRERMDEFVIYHRDGDGECNAVLLSEYARRQNLSPEDKFDLSYFFSIVYCCESAIILFKNREHIRQNAVSASEFLKPKMIFQSDRKYMKMKKRFENSLIFWSRNLQHDPIKQFVKNSVLDLQKALRAVEKWYMFGRFSAYLFLETYATMMKFNVTDVAIDWKNGDTATSGLLNLFGKDDFANKFDSSNVLSVPLNVMDDWLKSVKQEVKRSGGDSNTTKLETSLCAYRKFYKGTRYNGFYLDRMLEELLFYEKMGKYKDLTAYLFLIREELFDHELLGEKHGWKGIRQENKKLYLLYGII